MVERFDGGRSAIAKDRENLEFVLHGRASRLDLVRPKVYDPYQHVFSDKQL